MAKRLSTSAAEQRFRKLAAICLALPDAEQTVSGDHATYRVRGKVFAYFLNDHHGDGIVSVCVKSELGENADRARLDPKGSTCRTTSGRVAGSVCGSIAVASIGGKSPK